MRGLVPRIHVFAAGQDGDGRDKHRHDVDSASIRAEHEMLELHIARQCKMPFPRAAADILEIAMERVAGSDQHIVRASVAMN